MNGKITVLSCGIEPKNMAHGRAQLFAEADFLVGGRRQLESYTDFSGEKIVLAADTAQTVEKMCDLAAKGRRIIVLASGDALFHGIGGTFIWMAERFDNRFDLHIEPAPTAFQALFSRLKITWNRARFFSLHQGGEIPQREILSAPLAVVYGGSRINAAQAAAILVENFPESGKRRAILAENLGCQDEQIHSASLTRIAELACGPISILLLLETEDTQMMPDLALGLENRFYDHEKGLITSPEIRCVALSKLSLPPAGVLWDIGAGSGSVGLEAAALRPQLEVYALEKNPERIRQIENNRRRLGVANYKVVNQPALDGFVKFPPPDRIFIGGGGEQLAKILKLSFRALNAGGILVVSAVTLESLAEIAGFCPESKREVVQIAVARESDLAGKYSFMKNENQVTISVFAKGEANNE